jgi:glycine oxidase
MSVPRDSDQERYDTVVVGGGVIGLACAWRAAQRGLKVCVLERDAAGAGASGVAAGMLAPVGETAFGEGELLDLNIASDRSWPRFAGELEAASGQRVAFSQVGALHVALDRDEAEELRRRHDFQRRIGLEAEWLAPRRCRELEPGLTTACAGGVLAAEESSVDPRRLMAALVVALGRAGGELHTGAEVTGGVFEGDRLAGVRTADGRELRAAHVVLAAGCWSGQADWLPEDARPPVRPVKGQILRLRGTASQLPCSRIVVSERVYLVPREDGELVVGATVEDRGFDLSVTAGGVHELLREAYRALPDVAELEFVEASAGLRPTTPDNVPLIGPGAIPGLVLATGHFRNGVLLAPLTAERVCDALISEPASGTRLGQPAGWAAAQ